MSNFQMRVRYQGDYNNIEDLIFKRSGLVGEDRKFFLKPNHSKDKPFKPQDLEYAERVFKKHINKGSHIGLLIDPDVDGFTSGTILYKYLKRKGASIEYYLQKGKEHGLNPFVMHQIKADNPDLLIISDAGTNDLQYQQDLINIGIDIIIIDHHQIEDDNWYKQLKPPIINNHRKDNPVELNKELTGVGMTLRFLEYIEDEYLYEYYYLAALGQIGDSSDVADPEIRNIIVKGLDTIPEDSLINYIIEKEVWGRDFNQTDVAFCINPFINAMVRVGTMDEKKVIFNQLIGENDDYKEGLKLLRRAKNRQKRIVDRMKEGLVNNINLDGGVAVGYVENPEDKTVIGLVAGQIANSLNQPVLLLRDKDGDTLSGSGRGVESVLPSLKDWCEDTGLVNFVGGHNNAFGLGLDKDKWRDFISKAKEVKPSEYIYDVDNIHENIDSSVIKEYNKMNKYTGGSIEDVRIGIPAIEIHKDNLVERGSVTLINHGDVEFIIFNDHGETFNKLNEVFGDKVAVDVVGKPNVNHWMGKETYQVIIEDIQISNGSVIHEDIKLPKKKVDPNTIIF